jgi:DNA-binding Xre family transcriptional regulator
MIPSSAYDIAVFDTPLDRVLHEQRRTNVWLGGLVGCGDSEISRYRHGVRIPPLERQRKICGALHCEISDLWPLGEHLSVRREH